MPPCNPFTTLPNSTTSRRYGAVWLAQQPGVSLTAADNDGCQPIHAATLNGNLEMVRWLAQQPGVSLTTDTD